MDNYKGLELSLGLPCGGNSADVKADTDERTSKILNDFKNFLNAGISQPFQRIHSVKSQENLFSNLSQTTPAVNVHGNEPVSGDKRKNMFDESSNQKRQETETRSSDYRDTGKASRVSITTDEGSTADNEDVVDSGSPSRVVSHCDDGSKTPVGSGGSSQVSKEVDEKVNVGGPHCLIQPVNNMNFPCSVTIKESPSASTRSTSYKISNMMYTIPVTNGERLRADAASHGNGVPMSFGFSHVQLPVLDKDSPWGMVACSQALHSPYVGRTLPTSVPTQVSDSGSSEPIRLDGHQPERPKGQTKQPEVAEEGSPSHSEDDNNGNPNSFPSEYPSIRPGIAANMNFGGSGSGSFPNLPWVSTTGPGPNGKTISGVTYKYKATQIRIVCACHGTHMSADEFVGHASEDQPRASMTSGLASVPSSNPAASAKS